MTEEQMKERKKMLCDLMDNDLYVPMKIKELAILLDIPQRKAVRSAGSAGSAHAGGKGGSFPEG